MPKESGVNAAAEGAARKLLAGTAPNTLLPDELLAAIEALGAQRSTEAADVLASIQEPKQAAKAARRALFRLQTQGIHATRPSAEQPSAAAPRPAPNIKLLDARVSSYDPRGTRAVSILAEKPFTGLISLRAIANDTDGLLDIELTTTTKKAFYARLENFSRQYDYIDFVTVAPEYANQIVHRCVRLNESSKTAVPQDFAMWKSFGAEAPDPPLEPPILVELDVDEVRKAIPLDKTRELAHSEFEAWLYEEEALKEHVARLDTARGGPLVLSSDALKGREQTIVDEATDSIFQGDELGRAKERLQETAHYLLQHNQREAAELSLRAALSVDELPPHEQPFLRELVLKSIQAATNQDVEGHEHEHPHEHGHEHAHAPARTDSGIILPT